MSAKWINKVHVPSLSNPSFSDTSSLLSTLFYMLTTFILQLQEILSERLICSEDRIAVYLFLCAFVQYTLCPGYWQKHWRETRAHPISSILELLGGKTDSNHMIVQTSVILFSKGEIYGAWGTSNGAVDS